MAESSAGVARKKLRDPKQDDSSSVAITPRPTDEMLSASDVSGVHHARDTPRNNVTTAGFADTIQRSVTKLVNSLRGIKGYGDDDERLSEIDTDSVETMMKGGLDRFYYKYKVLIETYRRRMPSTELRFQNLCYTAEVPITKHHGQSIGTHVSGAFVRDRVFTRTILNNLSGVIPSASTTLVLGGPGSGKSSFLRAIAGKIDGNKHSKLEGTVQYNGLDATVVDVDKIVGLIDQVDVHAPTLTVRETIEFADKCLNGLPSSQPTDELRDLAQKRAELIMFLLGLNVCADTVVGNELLRGVSGGEKKRVTIGEIMVGHQSVFLCDEISTGLDSAATFDIIKGMKTWAKELHGTVLVALLQPPPEVVELFDNLILLDKGNIIYQGPMKQVLEYFESLGYFCPPRCDVAEFLLMLTTDGRKQYVMPGAAAEAPKSTAEFTAAFRDSTFARAMDQELQQGFLHGMDVEKTENRQKLQMHASIVETKKSSPFTLDFLTSTWILTQRQAKLTYRDRPLMIGKFMEALIVGLGVGILYFDVNPKLYFRMLFFSAAILQRQAWQQIPLTLDLRRVFYKQRPRNFYRTLSYGVAYTLVWVPINVVVALVLGTSMYWMAGLAPSAYSFFVFILTLVAYQHAIGAYMMFLGAISPQIVIAQCCDAVSVVMFLTFSGNIIFPDLIPPWWKWFFWINPLGWALRILVLNEFYSDRYSASNGGFPAAGQTTDFWLDSYQVVHRQDLIWGGLGVLLAYFILFTSLATIALHNIRYTKPSKKVVAVHENDYKESQRAARAAARRVNTPTTADDDDRVALATSELEQGGVTTEYGSLQSFVPATLAWKDLSYYVADPLRKGETKTLLHGVSAFAKPGTMTALMGATGAGKTTLMDVLAGRKTGGRMDGEIYVNGVPKDNRSFSRIAAYCEQMDIHSQTTTVKEALLFSARLRQPYQVSDELKASFVDEIIAMLELGPLEGKMVGELGKGGLTVEQRKRLTIGVELVANPSILFLDEPTSGLDALAATMVMKVIRRIASSGRTVVCTIHQPSLAIFESFDSLLLLKMGGHVVYFGPLGEGSSHLIDYFTAVPGTPLCPEHANPATYMLEVIGAGVGREKSGTATDYAVVYRASEHRRAMETELQTILDTAAYEKAELELDSAVSGNDLRSSSNTATPISFQLKMTITRAAQTYWRTPRYNLVRLLLFPFFGLFFGSVFWQIKIDSPSAVNSAVALNYMIMDFVGVFNLMTVIEITCAERAVFYRERAANMYSAFSYQAALFLAELPYLAVNITVFVTIMYWMVGFSPLAGDFFWYVWIYFLYGGLATYVGQLCCQLLPNEKVANIAVGAITIIYNIFSGFLLPVNQMKSWYKWITYIAPSSNAFSALSAAQFAQCRGDSGSDFGCRSIKNGNKTMTIESFVEVNFGFDADNVIRNMGVLMIEWGTTFLICYLALKFIKHIVR